MKEKQALEAIIDQFVGVNTKDLTSMERRILGFALQGVGVKRVVVVGGEYALVKESKDAPIRRNDGHVQQVC